jgi:mobilization protein NikA
MVRPSLRTKSIGTKVTQAEYATLERAAQERGKTLSEWCREIILASVDGPASKDQPHLAGDGQAVMAEVVALRTILLNVLFKQANGESITAEQMQKLIERADADKVKKATERLRRATPTGS